MLGCRAQAGGDQQRPTSFAVQPDRVRLVEPGPPHVLGRGVLEQVFLDGVA